ncbi:3-keto-5-aminohexanoate cleavage protein [Acuticoccus sp. I52.16.1]|uniref:3-keto-5-aminohexanoate cleavage protein n=1 Tax=Acuticoccus sp. I52.16.1 TaxID=2928472 RepID=UPI001FD47F3D|nr:3-keto-5-aminohexanoate cleavage protein [Acuticoccus sp. I52.16.1]UOM33094.1 3-keto-5-aminohexanoate cleavage protein [Acuticoccus sp. I52.16.1]
MPETRNPVVITCALTGTQDTRDKNPNLPVTPAELARAALDAAKAGAAVVHIHVRDPATGAPSMALEHYREVVDRIREENDDLVINLTTGPGARFNPSVEDPARGGPGTTLTTPERRIAHIEALRPEICTLDLGSVNFGDNVLINTPGHLRTMADAAQAAGVRPELEVFDLGHIELARRLIAEGRIAEPPLFQICLGIPYAAPALAETMIAMRDRLPPNAVWSGFGISRMQFPMVAVAATLGGHVRVGMEDNLYLSKGELTPSNAALVEKAARILVDLGHEPATPGEARRVFGLRPAA